MPINTRAHRLVWYEVVCDICGVREDKIFDADYLQHVTQTLLLDELFKGWGGVDPLSGAGSIVCPDCSASYKQWEALRKGSTVTLNLGEDL